MTEFFLKPAPGRVVDQPDGTPWPTDGMPTATSLFVRRRIADGDLIPAHPAVPAMPVPDVVTEDAPIAATEDEATAELDVSADAQADTPPDAPAKTRRTRKGAN